MAGTTTRSQTINFLGFLRGQLSGLQGIPTLCYELIQNADDVKDENDKPGGASRISFDVCDDALWIENDGIFREIDFNRMEKVSWGNKREEADTTGSFGIGFISVYQVTDSPELFSSGEHWRFQPQAPENQRIVIEELETEYTRFRLPWAFGISQVRKELGLPPVKTEQLDDFADQFIQSIENAALFLKQVRILEVKRNGNLLFRIEVVKDGNELLLDDGEHLIQWKIFEGSFELPARDMRQEYGDLIEEKRKADVKLAIPAKPLENGLLYAFLPSETHTGLPFQINADFYPSSDRKRILFDQDYKSDWNRLAIECVAKTLAEHTDKLLGIFSPQDFWEFAEKVKQASESPGLNAPIELFWEQLRPQISITKAAMTSAGIRVCPPETNYLDHDPEVDAAEIFEELNIHTVHSDLRKYRNTLIDTKAQLLKISTVGQAFHNLGYSVRTNLTDMPSSLQIKDNWHALWSALNSLWERASQLEKSQTELVLKGSAIAFGSDDALWPPEELFLADDRTRELFSRITDVVWFNQVGDSADIPASLVPAFDLDSGLDALEHSQDTLLELWEEELFSPQEIYEWLENHPETNYLEPYHRDRIRELRIWPTADGKLSSLEDLFLPGNFDDPLNLAQFVDIEALGGGRDFLEIKLQVRRLDFITYVREWIPSIIQSQELSQEKRIRLLEVMAVNLGKMQGNVELQKTLGNLDLVWCGDDSYCSAQGSYFDTLVIREVLGSKASTVLIPDKHDEAIRALYNWLGVAENPRITDVIARIGELSTESPTRSSVQSIQVIFGYLARRWDQWNEGTHRLFEPLKNIAWLPGTGRNDQWFKPCEVYIIFQNYLFASQGNFLRIDRKIQEISRNFNRFLEINITPNAEQVVRHLLHCANDEESVNREVYTFLTQNVDKPPILRLIGKRCLLLQSESGEEKYYFPANVFWDHHPFGSYRFRLGPEFGQYKPLFDRLGVKEGPTYEDAISVLKEISESKYAQSKLSLSDDPVQEQVIMASWSLISDALETEQVCEKEVQKELGKLRTIPNPQSFLYPPEWLLIEDRPGWGQKFLLLENNLIEKTEGTWPAMEAAGVRRLSKAINTELHQCENPREDFELQKRLIERKDLILRVIESWRQKGIHDFNLECLDELSFSNADDIEIIRSFQGFGKREEHPETVDSVHLDGTIYYISRNGSHPWIGIARELSYVLHDSGELSSLGMEIKEILSPDSLEQASGNLDEFGYPRVRMASDDEIDSPTLKTVGGTETGEEFEFTDEDPDETPDETPDIHPTEVPEPEVGGNGKKPTTKIKKPKRKTSRLISYVYPEDVASVRKYNPDVAKRRTNIGQLGVDFVLKFEEKQERDASDMETVQRNFEGFDVKSVDRQNTSEIRYIEVKSTSGRWDSENPAQMHSRQFETAQERGENYWLYVVEEVESDDPKLYCIQNPANRVDAFMFDHGWLPLAEAVDEENVN